VRKVLLVSVVTVAALIVNGTAQAALWKVRVGEQTKPPAGTPKGTALTQFFPAVLSVNAGDVVSFSSLSFHTATYLAGRKRPALFVPAAAKILYTGINDSTGTPFYFDGLPMLKYNARAFGFYGPATVSGRTPASAGAIFSQDGKHPGTAEFAFPKPGVFTLVCNVHPGMRQVVKVKRKGVPVASAADVAERARVDTAKAWALARDLANTTVPGSTVYMGVGGKTTILDMFPSVQTVKVGTTVRFVNKSANELHDVAFGPPAYLETFFNETDLFPDSPFAQNQVTPVFPYGTEPQGSHVYDGTNHGNGFMATPLTDGRLGGLPGATRVTFTAAGKYHYICFLHGPDMAGDIVVTQ
jgi:plastocyanin